MERPQHSNMTCCTALLGTGRKALVQAEAREKEAKREGFAVFCNLFFL
jgi:hypothetical protein